jgi:hypothetical protein
MHHFGPFFRRALQGVVTIIVAAAFTGCATFNRIATYPEAQKNTTVSVEAKRMSKMSELPLGAYYDESRHIIVTGHQKGLLTGMVFGVVGVVVADQMNESSGRDKFGSEVEKGSDLGGVLNELLAASITEGRASQWSHEMKDAGLQLTPYAVFTVEKNGDALLYAMLRAEIPRKDGKPTWSGRYFARAPGIHPLNETGWMTEERFSQAIRAGMVRALDACIDDTHGRLTGTATVTAKGKYPYINMDFELSAIVTQEHPDYVVVKLAVGDAMVLSGTHVLNRADYEIKSATFKDPRSQR